MSEQYKETEYCTQCPRQCPKDQLNCERGREYFGVEEAGEGKERHNHGGHGGHGKDYRHSGSGYGRDLENLKPEEQTLSQLLNRCGYIAARKGSHQQADQKQEKMFDVLCFEEQKQLRDILEKLLNQWMSERGKDRQ